MSYVICCTSRKRQYSMILLKVSQEKTRRKYLPVGQFLKIVIEVQSIYTVVLVSSIQQSESVIYMHILLISIFQILFLYSSLWSIELSFLCYIVSSYCYLFYIEQHVYVNHKLPIYPPPCPLITINLFSISVTLLLFCKNIHLYLVQIPHISDIIYLSF